jgi:hypothetical protein
MTHRIGGAAILDRWSLLIEGGAEQAEELLETIEERLERSGLGNRARWGRQDVALGRWWTPDARPFLVVRSARFGDVHVYISARAYGAHAELLRLVAVEPAWVKRQLAGLLRGGQWWVWSLPRGTGSEEELRSWLTVVHETANQAGRELARRLGGRCELLSRDTGDALAWW